TCACPPRSPLFPSPPTFRSPLRAVLPSGGGGAAGLAACPFWTSHAQPPGAVTSFAAPPQQAPALDLTGRLPAPATVSGQLSGQRSEEHTSELQSLTNIVCRL